MWFGNVYTKYHMSPDAEKVELIKAWPQPEYNTAVKSLLQTVQFCGTFMRLPADKT